MDTPTIQSNINRLRSDVSAYSGTTRLLPSSSMFPSLTFSVSKVYLAIPIVMLIVLLYWSPDFIKYDYATDKGDVVRRTSFKKLLTYWLILSGVFVVGIFGYNYRKDAL